MSVASRVNLSNDNLPAAPERGREFRSAVTMTALSLGGKSLGLVKTLVIAAVFGASGTLDAFLVAYTLPTMMPGLILGVVTTAFIPRFMRSAANGHDRIDWRGLNTLFTVVVASILGLAALVVTGRDAIVFALAPGLSADVHALAARLTALMAAAVVFFGINALLTALLQALHRFTVAALDSVITNTVVIAGCLLFVGRYGILALAISVIAGFALHTVLLIWANRRLLWQHIRPALDFSHADFRGAGRHIFPLLVGYLGATSMAIIDRMFVSTLDAGAISVLSYASMLALLPMEVFGQAVMTVFYPGLSQAYAAGDNDRLHAAHLRGLRMMLFVLLPAATVLVVLAGPIVSLLFERGAFTAQAAALTAATLAAYALGLPGRAVNYFNFRVFHARQEPWTAVSIGLFGVALNATLDYLLIARFGVIGIAAATTVAISCCAVLSSVLLVRRTGRPLLKPLFKPLAKLSLMIGALLIVLAGCEWLALHVAGGQGKWGRLALQTLALLPGLGVFVLVGWLLRMPEVGQLLRIVGIRAIPAARETRP